MNRNIIWLFFTEHTSLNALIMLFSINVNDRLLHWGSFFLQKDDAVHSFPDAPPWPDALKKSKGAGFEPAPVVVPLQSLLRIRRSWLTAGYHQGIAEEIVDIIAGTILLQFCRHLDSILCQY